MSKRRARHEKGRGATARFSHGDYTALVQEAEDKGTTVAAIIRMAWTSYQEKSEHAFLMRKLESRIVFKVFEVCSATLGLSEEERKAARQEFNHRVKNGGKS